MILRSWLKKQDKQSLKLVTPRTAAAVSTTSAESSWPWFFLYRMTFHSYGKRMPQTVCKAQQGGQRSLATRCFLRHINVSRQRPVHGTSLVEATSPVVFSYLNKSTILLGTKTCFCLRDCISFEIKVVAVSWWRFRCEMLGFCIAVEKRDFKTCNVCYYFAYPETSQCLNLDASE